jgi:CheY-like chemotaxis protein
MHASQQRLVVLLDVMMPTRNGLEVLNEILIDQRLAAEYAVVLVTTVPRTLASPESKSTCRVVALDRPVLMVTNPVTLESLLYELGHAILHVS